LPREDTIQHIAIPQLPPFPRHRRQCSTHSGGTTCFQHPSK
jgi:hypothetical protein